MILSYDAVDRLLFVSFTTGGGVLESREQVEAFARTLRARCESLPAKAHFFFDLENLSIGAAVAAYYGEQKTELCERYAATVWHFGGQLAERVMARNEATRRGQRANVFKTRAEALAAFRKPA